MLDSLTRGNRVQFHWEWHFMAHAPILGLFQSDLGEHVALYDNDGGVYLLAADGSRVLELGFPTPVHDVRISQCGQRLFVLDRSGFLHLYNHKGQEQWSQYVNEYAVAIDIRPEGQAIAVGASNGFISFFSGHGKKLRSLYLTHGIRHLKFAHDSGALVAADQHGMVSFLNRQFRFEWKLNMQTPCSGVDVNRDASLILLPAFSEGVYAFNDARETIGAYEIGSSVFCAALCQKGERILAANGQGHLHSIHRDGSLENHLELDQNIVDMDLNYHGNLGALVCGEKEIRALRIEQNGSSSRIIAPKLDPEKSVTKVRPKWEFEIAGESTGQIRLTANAAYGACITDLNQFVIWNQKGDVLVQETLDPNFKFRLIASRSSNIFLVHHDQGLYYFTPQNGLISNYSFSIKDVAVHDGGLHFALATIDNEIMFFDKSGVCVWKQKMDYEVDTLCINPRGNALFASSKEGTLRAYRQCGKLGWEKKPKISKMQLLLSSGELGNAYAASRAADGYSFTPQMFPKSSQFVLDRFGIAMVTEEDCLYKINHQGKQTWSIQSQEPILQLESIRDYTRVRLKSGRDLVMDQKGALIANLDPMEGFRQIVANHVHELIVMEVHKNEFRAKHLSEPKRNWFYRHGDLIGAFHAEMTGVSVALFCGKTVLQLDLVEHDQPAPETVAFLEF